MSEINGKDSDGDAVVDVLLPEGVSWFGDPPLPLAPPLVPVRAWWVGKEAESEPFPDPHIQLVNTVVACATWFDNHTKIVVVMIMFGILHLVQGMTMSIPFVSAANHRWYCMMNVSSEHFPMNPKT